MIFASIENINKIHNMSFSQLKLDLKITAYLLTDIQIKCTITINVL